MFLLLFPRDARQFERPGKPGSQRIYQKGFHGKRHQKCFYSHQNSACHQASSAYHLILPHYNDVGEMIDYLITQQR